MFHKRIFYLVIVIFIMVRCNPKTEIGTSATDKKPSSPKGITSLPFGEMPDGKKVSLYTLANSNGLVMKVINYGGIITSLEVPDRNGLNADVVLGYDSLGDYLRSNPYFGAVIGRYGNRIAKGKFTIDNKQYTLATNNAANHLHGGVKGFDKVFWNIQEHPAENGVALKLSYESKDMEEGYPGNLKTEVIYTLTDSNELRIQYRAVTDQKTIVNLTQHTYFNLSGLDSDILSHELTLFADRFLPVDETLIPTGELKPVTNTPFDFTLPSPIGSGINNKDDQLSIAKGYDHCWALSGPLENGMRKAAELYEPVSGRLVIVTTTEPGIQFYSGNFLDGSIKGKKDNVYNFRDGLCLETQHFPDSPNRKEFPSVILEPGQAYTSETVYRFTAR